MRSSKSIMTGVAVLAALALPMVAGAANKLVVTQGATDTPAMVVTDGGYVGINTTNPTSPLVIQGAGDPLTTSVFITNIGRASGSLATDSPGLNFFRNNDVSVNGGVPRNGDRLGYFAFGSTVYGAKRYTASFQSFADGVWAYNSYPTSFTISTTPSGSAFSSERLRITPSGFVGIGTAVPTSKLQVTGIVEYADNTAAKAAGLTAGAIYRTGDLLKIVH